MNLEARHIGSYGGFPATIIELTVNGCDYSTTENITDFSTNKVDDDFIQELRDLADELEDHNQKVDKLKQ